jgi:hypothetical protein
MSQEITFDQFKEVWLQDVIAGHPSNVQLGHRFAKKLFTQWLDIDENSEDIVFCDGSGDGGIDIAYLNTADSEGEDQGGDRWYLVQSKYGSAFNGTSTILNEAQKIIDTLNEDRTNLSSLTKNLIERLNTFRNKASDEDRLILIFATELPLDEAEKRALESVKAMGRARLGAIFDVGAISIETIYNCNHTDIQNVIQIKATLIPSSNDLYVGITPLINLYDFLKMYRDTTGDLDIIFEKNVRKYLGNKRKVNKGIEKTLKEKPEKFGFYNNGITIVVEEISDLGEGTYNLTDPYIVNGCQTTKTIWSVLQRKLESGGTGFDEEFESWKSRLNDGAIIIKLVKGTELLNEITRYTNSQTGVNEKDFISLESSFQNWKKELASNYNLYLEIQRGGWDSQIATQRQHSEILPQFDAYANAFDLLKVYAAGWLREPGLAYGKNPPFAPGGSIFNEIVSDPEFGSEDLYVCYLLSKASYEYKFGRRAKDLAPTRGQTRFLFFMSVVDILRDIILTDVQEPSLITNKKITRSLEQLFELGAEQALKELLDNAIQIIDEYLKPIGEYSLFTEENYKRMHDLNAYLKSEQLGKSHTTNPHLMELIQFNIRLLKRDYRDNPGVSPYNVILEAIKDKSPISVPDE